MKCSVPMDFKRVAVICLLASLLIRHAPNCSLFICKDRQTKRKRISLTQLAQARAETSHLNEDDGNKGEDEDKDKNRDNDKERRERLQRCEE